ncbi:zf-TFIIB domain-containing protein [Simiduia curdlanivorans]|uniref:Zf-TFIIB domain-containing protein n=1 Tax=Simiduia curdlanivorans TaxID=1492769 RepID=A0ABV8V184_9GAMM|nr:zf-TFIIB domain-containing protein [Simiduia curdlanivorans]MDN3637704.1 zf-TFIIB domain-containing protein [Simiduia curdlanivorans]
MKCTSCKQGELRPSFIDGLFRAHTCHHCLGNWVFVEDYVAWLAAHPDHDFSEAQPMEMSETASAMLCPVSGAIMQKIKLAADIQHKLDYSPAVGGIWLDKGEWELLKEHKLAGSLNKVLTRQWQKQIRADHAKQTFSDLYEKKFGTERYQKLKNFREWLMQQEDRSVLRAYLFADDPYAADK